MPHPGKKEGRGQGEQLGKLGAHHTEGGRVQEVRGENACTEARGGYVSNSQHEMRELSEQRTEIHVL